MSDAERPTKKLANLQASHEELDLIADLIVIGSARFLNMETLLIKRYGQEAYDNVIRMAQDRIDERTLRETFQ